MPNAVRSAPTSCLATGVHGHPGAPKPMKRMGEAGARLTSPMGSFLMSLTWVQVSSTQSADYGYAVQSHAPPANVQPVHLLSVINVAPSSSTPVADTV